MLDKSPSGLGKVKPILLLVPIGFTISLMHGSGLSWIDLLEMKIVLKYNNVKFTINPLL